MNIANLLPAKAKLWYRAARPRSLPATYAPLLVGGAMALANGLFNPLRFVIALIAALLLQIAANLINEYVDYTRGSDEQKTAGMGMVLSRGELPAEQVRAGAIATVAGGVILGLILVLMTGPTLLLIGAFGVLVVVAYTAGPFPLAYIGLGELAVFIAMGPLMTFGTYYAVTASENPIALLTGLPIAFTVAAILHTNNMRDIDADRAANKRTLAVRFGMRAALIEFAVLIYGAYVALIALVLAGVLPWTLLIGLVTLPEGAWLVSFVIGRHTKPDALHKAQGRTARLHWWLGLALTAGWLLYALRLLF